MSVHPRSGLEKLFAIVVAFFLIGFISISYFFGLSYCDDRTQLTGNHPLSAEIAPTVGDSDPNALLDLQIRFALRHKAALARLLSDQQNPASANYHQWLKTGEFFHRFGPSDAEVKAVTDWLSAEGFNLTAVAAGDVEFSGTVEQAQRTFAVKIAGFGNGNAYGNTTDPSIPVSLPM